MASRRVKPSGGFELWWWWFMRVSGLLLVFLALGHLCITHIINNVEVINYAFVADRRWAHPTLGVLWRIWDLTMISLALLHGFNGLRQVLWEFIVAPMARKLLGTALWSACLFLIVIGSYAILLFRRDADYLDRFYAANPRLAPAAYGAERPSSPGAAASTTEKIEQ